MRKKLIILGFALAAAAASALPSAYADPPVNSFCPAGTRRVDCVTDPTKFICCPNTALCFC
jgi:hypothetical protein